MEIFLLKNFKECNKLIELFMHGVTFYNEKENF